MSYSKTYRLCEKYGLVRKTIFGWQVISTRALHELLGEAEYQQCRKVFRYRGKSMPGPAEVEDFLSLSEPTRSKSKPGDTG